MTFKVLRCCEAVSLFVREAGVFARPGQAKFSPGQVRLVCLVVVVGIQLFTTFKLCRHRIVQQDLALVSYKTRDTRCKLQAVHTATSVTIEVLNTFLILGLRRI